MKAWFLSWRMKFENSKNACSSMNELSISSWGEYVTCEGNEIVPLGCKGYQAVIDIILKDIPEECFHMNTRVTEIIWSDTSRDTLVMSGDTRHDTKSLSTRCRVVTKTSEIFEADHVIVTSSLGFLKVHSNQLFKPPLPELKSSSINRLCFGTVNKIYLQFDKPFWNQSFDGIHFMWLPEDKTSLTSLKQWQSSIHMDWFKAIHGFDVVSRQTNLLCGWIAGEEAVYMESLPEDVVLDVCHELLQLFTRRDDIPRPSRIIRTQWNQNEYSLGSYSYHPRGTSVDDVSHLSSPLPSDLEPCLLFAGEATHPTYFSTTHGAMLSGQREADRIISHYSKHSSEPSHQ